MYMNRMHHRMLIFPAEFGPDDVLQLSVDVTNSGLRAGKEADQGLGHAE